MAYPLYLIASHLLLPLVFARLLLKSRGNPEYRRRWAERIGFYPQWTTARPIWIHTVSVGEFNAAKPLIRALQSNYPDLPILVTTVTPTGSAAVKAYQSGLYHVYLPYDLPTVVGRFLRFWQPLVGIIFETEIWPTLYRKTAAAKIPVIMANARLSEKSARGYQRIKPLISATLQHLTALAATTEADAQRLIDLGAEADKLSIMGNIKFDYQPTADAHEQSTQLRKTVFGPNQPIWIAASTHPGEEEQVLAAHAALLEKLPTALLILTPRHPERFDAVARLCESGFTVVRRSTNQPCDATTQVYLTDSMGELPLFYGCADAAFVGGSLVTIGGHNLIEPAALGMAPVFGPHMENFREISRLLLAADGGSQVSDSDQLTDQIYRLLTQPDYAKHHGDNALKLAQQHRGATDKLLKIIAGQLNPA